VTKLEISARHGCLKQEKFFDEKKAKPQKLTTRAPVKDQMTKLSQAIGGIDG
jgi:hypothetical protein